MKILQICPKPLFPPRDGGSLVMYNLARSLQKAGHTVTVLMAHSEKHSLTPDQVKELNNEMEVHAAYINMNASLGNLLNNLFFSRQPYNAVRLRSAEFAQKLTVLLQTQHYDVVQLEGAYLMHYLPVIRQNSHASVALRAHNIEHEIWQRISENTWNPLKSFYFRLLARRIQRFEMECINLYDLLVPISNRDLEQFQNMGNRRPACVCGAGIEQTFIPEAIPIAGNHTRKFPKDDFSLFFLGSLDWIPNQEGIIWFVTRVLPGFLKLYPHLKLHIAGRNAPGNLIRKLNLPGVVFHGEVEDSREFMMTYNIMVVPCFSGSGMRVKIIEAMSLGKPIITTPVGAEGLDAESGIHLIIAKSPMEFHNQLESLVNYPDLCHQLGMNAYNWVGKRFNNDDIAMALTQFYNSHVK